MDKCKLCQEREANQTGSHIIPFFLLKSLVNEDVKDKRDKETSFKVSSSDLVSFYMGRNLSPDKIEGLLGRELTDEEIQKNLNHYTCDNILCSFCEKRLQIIESQFNDLVYTKIPKANRISLNTKLKFTDNLKASPELIKLFFLSIIWRCAVTHFLNFKLDRSVEENLRNFVDSGLPDKVENLSNTVEFIKGRSKEIPMGVLYEEQPEDSTRNFCFIHQSNRAPYYFIFNEFVVLYYHKKKTFYREPDKCLGLEKLHFKGIINFREGVFKIGLVNKNDWEQFRASLITSVTRIISKRIENSFIRSYQNIKGFHPSPYLRHRAMKEITGGGDSNFVDNYTIKNVAKAFTHFMG
jgi:hypothetical protein